MSAGRGREPPLPLVQPLALPAGPQSAASAGLWPQAPPLTLLPPPSTPGSRPSVFSYLFPWGFRPLRPWRFKSPAPLPPNDPLNVLLLPRNQSLFGLERSLVQSPVVRDSISSGTCVDIHSFNQHFLSTCYVPEAASHWEYQDDWTLPLSSRGQSRVGARFVNKHLYGCDKRSNGYMYKI